MKSDWPPVRSGNNRKPGVFGWVIGSFGFAGLLGVVALIWGSTRQVYRVPLDIASDAFLKWCTDEPRVDPSAGERYLAMFGDRYFWIDLGSGLIATGTAGLVLSAALALNRQSQPLFRTPSRPAHFLLVGWAVLGWTYFSVVCSLEKDLDRRIFPWCADSIGIPLYSATFSFMALLTVCTVMGSLLMLCFGKLPVPLTQWNEERPRFSWMMTIVFGALIGLIGLTMILDSGNSTSIANPAGLVAIYLLASTRAALLGPKAADE